MFRCNSTLVWALIRLTLINAIAVFFSVVAFAATPIHVVTTITDLKALVDEVGGSLVKVESLSKGSQDPHYIEAKPSFMVKVSQADLVLAVGLDLEVGWLPSILQGARNPKVIPGSKGYLELGNFIDAIDKPAGNVSRADGDVHPEGNPHFYLDPIRMGDVALKVASVLGEIDNKNKNVYLTNAKALQQRLKSKSLAWKTRLQKAFLNKSMSAVTYHKTLAYFFDRFGIKNAGYLEPKPGIPPTSGHILELIKKMKQESVSLILVENFFDPSVTKKIKQEIANLKIDLVPVSVGGAEGINTLDDLYEHLVKTIEGK